MVAAGLFFASLLAFASASPAGRQMTVHETRSVVPSSFVKAGPAAANATITLRIALTQSDTKGLVDALYAVSTPSSASYGEHLSKDEVEKFVAPSAESVAAVNAWLSSQGIQATTLSPAGDWLGFTVSVEKANALLDTDFSVYTHTGSGKQFIRTTEYSIPASLQGMVDFVHPTITFSTPNITPFVIRSPAPSSNGTGADATTVTPAYLQSLYGIPTTKATQSSNSIGVAGYIGQNANKKDLTSFLTKYRTDIPSSTTFQLQTLDGGEDSQTASDAGDEANLDIQYTVGVATGVPTYFISVGTTYNDGDLEGFLDIINYLLAEDAPPQVLTTSYGDDESNISPALASKLCDAYAQLGARGTSILFASGDGGVSGSQSTDCTAFVPTFPSGCPYLTSVGSTTGSKPETAADFSSGGFSNYFGIPDYQSANVASYLSALGDTNSGSFNQTGRAYPDVSTQGQNVVIYNAGRAESVAGTSCSSPIFASVIALLNDELIAAGKSPLGFLNPWLYSTAAGAFTDITSGSNPGCNTDGFPAQAGWDPVTGLGTPVFSKLKAAAGL